MTIENKNYHRHIKIQSREPRIHKMVPWPWAKRSKVWSVLTFTKKLSAETVVLPFPHFLTNPGNRKSGLDIEREVIEKATVFSGGG